jgi:hypothetical protein
MAVTAVLVRATDYRLFYAIDHDGAAGDSLTVTNATLQADAAGKPHLLKVLQTSVADDAAAVGLLMAGVGSVVRITPGTQYTWSVDAQENGANLAQLVIDGEPGQINNGLLELQVTFAPMFRA